MHRKIIPVAIISFLVLLITIMLIFLFFDPNKLLLFFSGKKFICPVPEEICKEGKVIKIQGKYFAIGYKLMAGETVKAISDGKANLSWTSFSPEIGGGTYSSVTLDNNNYKFQYFSDLRDLTLEKQDYSVGETLFSVGGGNIGSLEENLLIIVSDKGKVLELKPSDFK